MTQFIQRLYTGIQEGWTRQMIPNVDFNFSE